MEEKTNLPLSFKTEKTDILASLMANGLAGSLGLAAKTLGQITPLRQVIVKSYDRKIHQQYQQMMMENPDYAEVISRRRDLALSILYTVNRALDRNLIGSATLNGVLGVISREILFRQDSQAIKEFETQFHHLPPSILALAPGKTCNLSCKGCYADSRESSEKLPWSTLRRIIREAKELWGVHFFVITGGEPLLYQDQGKNLLNLAEENPDCFFLCYTNGTLINGRVAQEMGNLGNITPGISIEGMKETTDRRRGKGVFDRVVTAMEHLRENKVPFGISMTATTNNYQELLAEETLDFYFEKMGALYGWLFQYMPIGRSISLDLMPTPEQRLKMFDRMFEVVKNRQYFLADFWNSGLLADGCIAAGGRGGYLYIDWNGNVTPCAFVPYSPVNINKVYAEGQNLNDVWNDPFFASIRQWQQNYNPGIGAPQPHPNGNLLRPCLYRDHYEEFLQIQNQYQPQPIDYHAQEALKDSKYRRGMNQYDQRLADLSDPLWKEKFSQQSTKDKKHLD